MKKLMVYLVVILLVLSAISGCAPSYCNPNSPDYAPQACQQWRNAYINAFNASQTQRQNTYWQEQAARQQYYNYRK